MADRYWRGGTGSWTTASTTNWSTSSNGAGGASVPTASDNVIFDQAATYTVTLTGALLCANITVSAGTVTFTSTGTIAISGSMSLVATTVWNGTGALTFNATTAQTINFGGITLDSPMNFNGVGGSWTLGSNFGFGKNAIRAMTLTNGTLDGGGFTVSSTFASTVTVTTGTVTIRNLTSTLTGLTTLTGSGNLTVSTYTISGAFTFTSGTLTLGAAARTGAFTFTAGTLNLNSYTLTVTSMAATGATVRTFAYGTGNITCTGSGTVWTQATIGTITVTGTPVVNITNSTATATTVIPGIATETTSVSFNFTAGTYALTFLGTATHACRNINFTTWNGVWNDTTTGAGTGFAGTWNAVANCTIYGSLILSSLMTTTGSATTITFAGTGLYGDKTLVSNGKGLYGGQISIFNGIGSTWLFRPYYDAGGVFHPNGLSWGPDSTGSVTFVNGTFDGTNNYFPMIGGGTSPTLNINTGTVTFKNWNGLSRTTQASGTVIYSSTVPSFNEIGTTNFNRHQSGLYTLTSGTLTINGALSITSTNGFVFTAGTINLNANLNVGGSFTYTAGTLNLNSYILQIGSMATWAGTGTRAMNFGTGYITCLGNWDQAALGTLTISGSRSVYITGTTTAKTIVTAAPTEALALDFYFCTGTYTLTFTSLVTRTLDFTGKTIYLLNGVPFTGNTGYSGFTGTLAATPASTIYGNLMLYADMTLTASTNVLTLGGAVVGTKNIITGGKALDFPVTINSVGSTFVLTEANLIMGATAGRALILTNGTIDGQTTATISGVAGSTFSTNTNSVTVQNVNFSIPFTVTSGTCTLSKGAQNFNFSFTSTVTLTAGTLILGTNLTTSDAFTLTAGTLNLSTYSLTCLTYTATGATTRALTFGTGSYIQLTGIVDVIWNTATPGTLTVTGTSDIRAGWDDASNTMPTIIINTGAMTEAQALNFNFYGSLYNLNFLNATGYTAKNVNFSNINSNSFIVWNTGGGTIYGNYTNIITASSGYAVLGGSSTSLALTFGGSATSGIRTINSPYTIPQSVIFNSPGSTWQLLTDFESGSVTTLTAGTLDLSNYVLRSSSFNSSGSTARTLVFGAAIPSLSIPAGYILCTGTDLQTAGGTIYTTATITNFTYTGTSLIIIQPTIGGGFTYTVATGTGTEAQAMNFSFRNDLNNAPWTLTFLATASYSAKNVDMSTFTGTWTATSTGTIYGDITSSGYVTTTVSTSAMTFGGVSGTKSFTWVSIDPATYPINFPITFNGVSSTWNFGATLVMASNKALTLTNGKIDLQGNILQVGSFVTGTGTKELTMRSGRIEILGSGTTAFNNAQPTGFTITSGEYGIGYIYMNSASAKTFVGGGTNYAPDIANNRGIQLFNNGAGTLTISGNNTFLGFVSLVTTSTTTVLITGSNTFRTFAHTTGSSLAATYTFTVGTTQNFNIISISGDGVGPNVIINTSTAGSQATFNLTGAFSLGSAIAWTSIRDIYFTPHDATGAGLLPIAWYIDSSSTNTSNNTGAVVWTGWNNYTYYVITNTSTTSWTRPTNFTNYSWSIYLLGGGGGGGGSTSSGSLYRASGGGGGGGGYASIGSSLRYMTTIPLKVGAGGAGGAGASSASGEAISLGASGGFTFFGVSNSPMSIYAATFNGTSQYLQTPVAFPKITTERFCIEAWVYLTSFANSPVIIECAYQNSTNQGGWRLGVDTNGVVGFYLAGTGASSFTRIQSTTAITLNQPMHVAVVRDISGYQTIYVNGTHSPLFYQPLSLSQNSGGTQTDWNTRIGGAIIDGNFVQGVSGKISNVRITIGNDPYGGNFSPSGYTLLNFTNYTKLLTCHVPSDPGNTGTHTIYDGSTANSGTGWSMTNIGNVVTSTGDLFRPIMAQGGSGGSSMAFVSGSITQSKAGGGAGYAFGGNGGVGASTSSGAYAQGGGGGGGGAGANGVGGAGGNGTQSLTATQASGGGGGGATGGTAGSNGATTAGGNGGYNILTLGRGTGSASAGGNGTNGGGGAGGQNLSAGGNSANYGADWINTWGPSGGGGGSAGTNATNTVGFAGGGGGAGQPIAVSPGTPMNGGNGGNGIIVIQYFGLLTSSNGVQNSSSSLLNFFMNSD